ncbi:hypothetical protein PR048_024939 [Dryococelus australis]|uniref:Uncharacterized protein n=1 Tax=Dryococelus australis TaxID=614101 RepID=A0ABQ9GPZ9_9NEOP|nr:hypothetical protein PR048_024939 [Dryococelus australis]
MELPPIVANFAGCILFNAPVSTRRDLSFGAEISALARRNRETYRLEMFSHARNCRLSLRVPTSASRACAVATQGMLASKLASEDAHADDAGAPVVYCIYDSHLVCRYCQEICSHLGELITRLWCRNGSPCEVTSSFPPTFRRGKSSTRMFPSLSPDAATVSAARGCSSKTLASLLVGIPPPAWAGKGRSGKLHASGVRKGVPAVTCTIGHNINNMCVSLMQYVWMTRDIAATHVGGMMHDVTLHSRFPFPPSHSVVSRPVCPICPLFAARHYYDSLGTVDVNVEECTNSEMTDMVWIYGDARGNDRAAARVYSQRYPARRQPNHHQQTQRTRLNSMLCSGELKDKDEEGFFFLPKSDSAVCTRAMRKQLMTHGALLLKLVKIPSTAAHVQGKADCLLPFRGFQNSPVNISHFALHLHWYTTMKRNSPNGAQKKKRKKKKKRQSFKSAVAGWIVPEICHIIQFGININNFESEEQTQIETDNQERQGNERLTNEPRECEEDKLEEVTLEDDKLEEDSLSVDLIKRGSEAYQNKDGPFDTVTGSGDKIKGSIRRITSDCFYISLPNGEKILRTWMAYSLKNKLTEKKALDITDDIIKTIEQDGIDIALCRGQGYDNGSTMTGVLSGVQARIRKLNPKALFIPCANYSLNLFGVYSFATVSQCVNFFGALGSLYCFFSVSTYRWTILVTNVGVTVKRLSDTIWSAHYEAVKPVHVSFKEIVNAIEELCDPAGTVKTRGAAQTLLPVVCDFSFSYFLYFWNNVLEAVNHTQKYLQNVGISLEKCAIKMRSLKNFLKDKINESLKQALQFATNIWEEMDIPLVKRRTVRKKKMMPGEKAQDEPLSLKEEFEKINVGVYWQVLSRDRHSQQIHGKYISSFCSSRAQESDHNLRRRTSINRPHPQFEEAVLEKVADDASTTSRAVERRMYASHRMAQYGVPSMNSCCNHTMCVGYKHWGQQIILSYVHVGRLLQQSKRPYVGRLQPTRGYQHHFAINIWAGIVGDNVIGPFLLPNSVVGFQYYNSLQFRLTQLIENVPLAIRERMWLQHHGAPPHFTRNERDHLNTTYPDRWIGRWMGPGFLKACVYETPVASEKNLLARVVTACDHMRDTPGVFQPVRQSLIRLMNYCIDMDGAHFEHAFRTDDALLRHGIYMCLHTLVQSRFWAHYVRITTRNTDCIVHHTSSLNAPHMCFSRLQSQLVSAKKYHAVVFVSTLCCTNCHLHSCVTLWCNTYVTNVILLFACWFLAILFRRAASLLATHQAEPGSIPGWVTPGYSHVGIVPDDAAGGRVFTEFSRLPHTFIPAQLHTHLNHLYRLSRPRCYVPPHSLHTFGGDSPLNSSGCMKGCLLTRPCYCYHFVCDLTGNGTSAEEVDSPAGTPPEEVDGMLIAIVLITVVLIASMVLIVALIEIVARIAIVELIVVCVVPIMLCVAPTTLRHWSTHNLGFVLNNAAPLQAATMLPSADLGMLFQCIALHKLHWTNVAILHRTKKDSRTDRSLIPTDDAVRGSMIVEVKGRLSYSQFIFAVWEHSAGRGGGVTPLLAEKRMDDRPFAFLYSAPMRHTRRYSSCRLSHHGG